MIFVVSKVEPGKGAGEGSANAKPHGREAQCKGGGREAPSALLVTRFKGQRSLCWDRDKAIAFKVAWGC